MDRLCPQILEVLQTIFFFCDAACFVYFWSTVETSICKLCRQLKFQLKGYGMLCDANENTSVDFCYMTIHQVILDKDKNRSAVLNNYGFDCNLCGLHLPFPLLNSLEPRRVHQEGVVKHVELVTQEKCECLKNEQNVYRP